jgi:hypothetical protein
MPSLSHSLLPAASTFLDINSLARSLSCGLQAGGKVVRRQLRCGNARCVARCTRALPCRDLLTVPWFVEPICTTAQRLCFMLSSTQSSTTAALPRLTVSHSFGDTGSSLSIMPIWRICWPPQTTFRGIKWLCHRSDAGLRAALTMSRSPDACLTCVVGNNHLEQP